MAQNIFKLFLERLFTFPLWIKQIIHFRLTQNLQEILSDDFIFDNREDIFQLYAPALTFLGKTEIEERKKGFDAEVYTFLTGVDAKLTILEIAMNNFWTMEEIAKHFMLCLDNDIVKKPESIQVYATAGFISGKFRTGEYFKRVGKIDANQLETLILKQKELVAAGTPKKMAEIMISLGFLDEKECKSLLIFKNEAKKRFILSGEVMPENISSRFVTGDEYKEQIARLTEQNVKLKYQLTKLMSIVKKNG